MVDILLFTAEGWVVWVGAGRALTGRLTAGRVDSFAFIVGCGIVACHKVRVVAIFVLIVGDGTAHGHIAIIYHNGKVADGSTTNKNCRN